MTNCIFRDFSTDNTLQMTSEPTRGDLKTGSLTVRRVCVHSILLWDAFVRTKAAKT